MKKVYTSANEDFKYVEKLDVVVVSFLEKKNLRYISCMPSNDCCESQYCFTCKIFRQSDNGYPLPTNLNGYKVKSLDFHQSGLQMLTVLIIRHI